MNMTEWVIKYLIKGERRGSGMIRTFCDRCGEEAEANTFRVVCGRELGDSVPDTLDLCENCADALRRFLGIGSDEYETLESEDKKQEAKHD